jgi:hypothetical protein
MYIPEPLFEVYDNVHKTPGFTSLIQTQHHCISAIITLPTEEFGHKIIFTSHDLTS